MPSLEASAAGLTGPVAITGCENGSAALRMSRGEAGSCPEGDFSKHQVFRDMGHDEDQSHKRDMHKCYCDPHYYLLFV